MPKRIPAKQIGTDLADANIDASAAIALSKLAEAVIQADGGEPFSADQPMGSNKLTGLADPTSAQDAATKAYVDSLITGLQWRAPVAVLHLVGNANIATIDGLSPTLGDAYVVTDAGTPSAGSSDAMTAGDIAEYNGTEWKLIVDAVGGFPPDGTRAVLSTQTALITPYTDAADDGQIVDFTGASLTGVDTGDSDDGAAILVNADGGNFENQAYVFDGTVPTGTWIQFSGTGATFGTPVALGAANAIGSSGQSAQSDHVHKRDTITKEAITTEAITGSDTAIADTLASVPITGSLELFLNGIKQIEGAGEDYTLSSQTITWLASSGTAVDLEASDDLDAHYLVQG